MYITGRIKEKKSPIHATSKSFIQSLVVTPKIQVEAVGMKCHSHGISGILQNAAMFIRYDIALKMAPVY